MKDFGDMEAVKEYLAPFILDGSSPFCFTVGAPYFPMRDKLAQVQADCCCEFVDLVTREEQLPSLYALLQYLMQVPKLDGETMPEFTDVPPCFGSQEATFTRRRIPEIQRLAAALLLHLN
jgi:hypothetical protein